MSEIKPRYREAWNEICPVDGFPMQRTDHDGGRDYQCPVCQYVIDVPYFGYVPPQGPHEVKK